VIADITKGADMTILHRSSFAVFLASLVAAIAAGGANAQTDAIRAACQSSVRALCPKEVAAMDRTAARACLVRNIAKATPACRDAVQAYKAQHPNAAPN
jgi:hypothetical protein